MSGRCEGAEGDEDFASGGDGSASSVLVSVWIP